MQQKEMLNHRQIAWLVAVVLIASGVTSLNKSITELSKVDAWFAELGGVIYGMMVAWFFYTMACRFPGKNLYEISFLLFGRWFGGLINLFFLLQLSFMLIRYLSVFGDFMNTTLLPKTPTEIILLLLAVVMIYYCSTSVEVAARVNDLMFPLFLLLLFTLPLMLTNEFSFSRLQPVLGTGYSMVMKGNILALGWYGDTFLVGAYLHMVSNPAQLRAAVRHGVTLTGLALTVLLFLSVTILGPTVAGKTLYPSYLLVEQIQITDFLDRMELVIFSVWLPAFFLKGVFIMHAALATLASFTKKTPSQLFSRHLIWLILLLTLLSFESIAEVFNFGNYGAFVVILLPHPILYALFLLRSRKKGKEQSADMERTERSLRLRGPLSGHRRSGPIGWLLHLSANQWKQVTHGLLALCALSILVGGYFGQDYVLVGMIGGGLYGGGMVLAAIASSLEMRRTNLAIKKQVLGEKQEAESA